MLSGITFGSIGLPDPPPDVCPCPSMLALACVAWPISPRTAVRLLYRSLDDREGRPLRTCVARTTLATNRTYKRPQLCSRLLHFVPFGVYLSDPSAARAAALSVGVERWTDQRLRPNESNESNHPSPREKVAFACLRRISSYYRY